MNFSFRYVILYYDLGILESGIIVHETITPMVDWSINAHVLQGQKLSVIMDISDNI